MQNKTRAAIFTVQHDEDFNLPMWIKYYSQHFNTEDMYVISHNCNEELMGGILNKASLDGINVTRITTDEIFNHKWLNELVEGNQRALLDEYEYVIYTDCDEFIYPTNGTLKEFLENATDQYYRCTGYSTVGDKMYRTPGFDKTLIVNSPLKYCAGYHLANIDVPVSENLHLYHLHRLNYDESWKRTLRLSHESWDPKAVSELLSWENRINEEVAFSEWFHADDFLLRPYSPQLVNLLSEVGYIK